MRGQGRAQMNRTDWNHGVANLGTQAINELEDKLYTATQTVNFTPILDRITATLNRLVSASFETKKTLINSVIQRLDVGGGGEIIHLTPSPWARYFF